MKITELNIEPGTKIMLYVNRASDGSGSSMGPGVEGDERYLTEVVWNGPIYNGVMGSARYLDGDHIGLPISAEDVISANPNYLPMW